MLMIITYSIVSVFIAWIWVDYYRLIDIYEKGSLKYFILTFALGCTSVLIVHALYYLVLDHFYFELNGEFLNDFLFCVFKIGLVEEIAKTVPFLIMFLLFRKQFTEPIDYVAFFSISALGFSATENVMYFHEHGPSIIGGRAVLSTVAHMFNSALVAYGIIRYKYYHKGNKVLGVITFFFLAALSHGFYDFWLLYDGVQGGFILTLLYFLITISIFAVILNNAMNNSSFFTYKKVINSDKILKRLLSYYGIVFLIEFIMLVLYENLRFALGNLIITIFTTGFILFITCIRLSRFKLIQNRWEDLKLEMPFTMGNSNNYSGAETSNLNIKMKGDSFNESYINTYYEEFFMLHPLSQRHTHIGSPRLAYIDRKIFLYNDDTYYVVKVFIDGENGRFETMLIKPKTASVTRVHDKYPIVALLKIENFADLENTQKRPENFKFREWAYLMPR